MREKNSIGQRLREYTYHGQHLSDGLQRWLVEADGALTCLFLMRRDSAGNTHSFKEIIRETGLEHEGIARDNLKEMEKLGILKKDTYFGRMRIYEFENPNDLDVRTFVIIVKDAVRALANRINAFREDVA